MELKLTSAALDVVRKKACKHRLAIVLAKSPLRLQTRETKSRKV